VRIAAAALVVLAAAGGARADEKGRASTVYEEADALIRSGDRKQALRLLKDAVKTDPAYPLPHLMLGRVYFLMQKEEEALKEFDTFRSDMKDPAKAGMLDKARYIQSLYYMGEVYFAYKRYDDFREVTEDIIAIDPKEQAAHYNLGIYYYNAKRNRSKAYQSFKKTTDLDPSTLFAKKARYAIEFMRNNPDPRFSPDLSFEDQDYRN